MKTSFLIAITLSTLIFAACGGDSKDDGVSTSKLKGEWESLCENISNGSKKSLLTFTKDELTTSNFEYNDIGCNDNNLIKHIDIYYTYELGDTIDTKGGKKATKISQTVTGSKVSQGTYSNTQIPQTGTLKKAIIFIDTKKLYQGEDKSPYELDFQHYYMKK